MRYFEILAATAYKEFAHSLSNKSLQRLKDAGLISRLRVKQALTSLENKYKVPYKKLSETKALRELGSYYNSNDGYIYQNIKGIRKKAEGFHNYGILDKDYTGILDGSTYYDAMHHEYSEAMFNADKFKNENWRDKTGHFSPRVIVQERKMHNQTGGNFIRNNGVTWADMREAVVDDSEVLSLLEGQKRLRNRDYKRVARTAMQAKDMRDLYHKIYQTRI